MLRTLGEGGYTEGLILKSLRCSLEDSVHAWMSHRPNTGLLKAGLVARTSSWIWRMS
ncbi:MAG: hypothetical protein GHCLOJNM_03524 [bacterium]|nr:hypothetical protein [bacterium]